MKYSVSAVICAAGKGLRAGFPKNKLLVPFLGSCALQKTLEAFNFSKIDEIIVTASPEDFEEISCICEQFPRTKTVLGGETRTQSVYNALQQTNTDIVLVHDGARPFISQETIENCIESVIAFGSGVCAIPAVDTTAFVKDGAILSVPNRSELYSIQTPQGFFLENLLFAYERATENGKTYTDDSSLFAEYCGKPHICNGKKDNIKLTYPEDFRSHNARCGFGVDTHAFGKPQDYILLAGVKIPSDSGLIAHSDGDVLAHAVMDSLLSAAGLRDIGYYFPDSDPQWKNADSMKMLESVIDLLKNEGFAVKNLSVAIQAEKPRLAKYIEEMKNRLASVLHVDPTKIGISAGTNEGLGYIGEGKGITVNAYTLLCEL